MTDFAAIDFETANEQPSSVCSVGVVIVRDGEIVDSFYSLIHPEPKYYQWFCQQVHGLGLLLILSIIICNSYAVAAQEIMRNGKSAPDYFSLEVNTFATASNIWSASYWERGYADNMLIGFDLRFGARIRKDWSLFLKTEIPCLVADRYSSQNVISKANLGVGASYIINPADWKVFLQPSVSVLSTGFKNADSYLKPDIEFRIGIDSRFKPYLGIRAEYLYSYNNPLRRHFLYGICFGIILL